LEDCGTGGEIILKEILKEYDLKLWTDLLSAWCENGSPAVIEGRN
jgi:hypothetical protein